MNAPIPTPSILGLRPEAEHLPTSGIVDVFNYGRGREGLIPLWVGEGDLPTPAFICEAANRSLAAGETFYTYQRGIPALREALACYHERVYGRPSDPERFFVTSGGMPAVMMAVRIVAGAGDEVIVSTPAWPNYAGAISMVGAQAVSVPLTFSDTGWKLDLDRLADAVTSRTRAVVVNSPANPTGWTATEADLYGILEIARQRDLWIIADEVYGRFVFDPDLMVGDRAPSFHDVMAEDDRIVFVQTFSKNWAMTGWRLGWLEAPPALGQIVENLVQYSTSGTPVFVQRAGVAALEQGEAFLAHQIERARQGRKIVRRLASAGCVDWPLPAGAFYAFLRVHGLENSPDLAMRLVDEANVGLAPGSAFGPGGESYLRLCFARKSEDLEEAVNRLTRVLPQIAM